MAAFCFYTASTRRDATCRVRTFADMESRQIAFAFAAADLYLIGVSFVFCALYSK
jgi:hypothetical protein